MRWGLWIGAPSIVALLASADTQIMENVGFFFLLSVAALVMAILPLVSDRADR